MFPNKFQSCGPHGHQNLQTDKVFEAIDALKIEIKVIKNKLDGMKPCQVSNCPDLTSAHPPPAGSQASPGSPPPHQHRRDCEQLSQGSEQSLRQADHQPGQLGQPPDQSPGHDLTNDQAVLNEDLDISVVSLDQEMEEFDFSSNHLNWMHPTTQLINMILLRLLKSSLPLLGTLSLSRRISFS